MTSSYSSSPVVRCISQACQIQQINAMRGLKVLLLTLFIGVTSSSAATVIDSFSVSNIMSAAYQLKARMEMQKLEGMAFQTRTLAKLQKIQADLQLREETEKLEIERVRALAPRGIQGAPGPVGMAGEPGAAGLPGDPGSRGTHGQDGRVPNEASLVQDINHLRAVAQINRNYLNELVYPNGSTFGSCGEIIILDGQETIALNTVFVTKSCSWVVWSVHGANMRVKLTGPRDAQYSMAVGGSTVSVPVGSWVAVSAHYALIHYSSNQAYNEPSTLVVEETSIGSNNILPTNSFVYSEPFALTYPLPPASQYRDNERTFIIGRAVCGDMSTSVRIYDVNMENSNDWIETTWLDTSVTPPRLHSGRLSGSSGTTFILPPSTSFLSMFYTDHSVVGRGFKILVECQ